MAGPERLGGRYEAADGATVVWSVAEGVRGRRWRWVRTDRAGATTGVLLETSPAGRPTRLEVASAAGLLTLHPERDEREAHGNVVAATGVRPLAFRWGADHVFDVADLPWVAAACARSDARPTDRPALLVDRELRVVPGTRSLPADVVPPGGEGERWPLE